MEQSLIDTDEVLRRLAAVGLAVTSNMLAQDRHDGYLPRLIDDPRGPGGGIDRLWEPWMVRRALYLYRLRRLRLKGDLLRVLVFFYDGWGWERVRPVCVTGMRKMVNMQASSVRRTFRQPTPTGIALYAEDLAKQDGMNLQTALLIWGGGFFGKPLPGGTFEELFRTVRSVFPTLAPDDDATVALASEMFGRMLEASGLTWEKMLALVADANPEQANKAREYLLTEMLLWRRALHAYCRDHHERIPTTNAKALFGVPRDEFATFLRTMPGRITAAQLLAGLLGPMIAAVYLIESGYVKLEGGMATIVGGNES